jgi:hypothetical protein
MHDGPRMTHAALAMLAVLLTPLRNSLLLTQILKPANYGPS